VVAENEDGAARRLESTVTDAEYAATIAHYGEQTVSERWENLMQGFSDHHRGEHDWSSIDPYDCVVCHVLVSLYGETIRAEATP
jgi:hypothetical protein